MEIDAWTFQFSCGMVDFQFSSFDFRFSIFVFQFSIFTFDFRFSPLRFSAQGVEFQFPGFDVQARSFDFHLPSFDFHLPSFDFHVRGFGLQFSVSIFDFLFDLLRFASIFFDFLRFSSIRKKGQLLRNLQYLKIASISETYYFIAHSSSCKQVDVTEESLSQQTSKRRGAL